MLRRLSFLALAVSTLIIVRCNDNEVVISSFKPLSQELENEILRNLGERLFFDTKLSIDNSVSCANCHIPALAFTDGDKLSTGIHGRKGKRNSPSLFNAVNQDLFMWDGGVKTLELQALVPLQDTNEMGSMISDLIPELAALPYYDSISMLVTGESFGPSILTRALGAYQRSLYREDSEFDKWQRGEINVSDDLEAGYDLFSNKLNCVACHTPPTFTNNELHNNGLYANYEDQGRYLITGDSSDIGKFKVPSLRNVEITSPYMHDGSLESLDEVIAHYQTGGKENDGKSEHIKSFSLTEIEKNQLILFLKSLSDVRIKKHWEKVFNTRY